MDNEDLCEEEMIAVVLEAARLLSGEDRDENRRHTLILAVDRYKNNPPAVDRHSLQYMTTFLNSDSHAVIASVELTNVCLPRTTPDGGCLESFHADSKEKAKTRTIAGKRNASEMIATSFSTGGVITRSMRTKKAMSS